MTDSLWECEGVRRVWNDGATLTNQLSQRQELSLVSSSRVTSNQTSGSNPLEDSIILGSERQDPQLRGFQCPMQFNLSNGRLPRTRTRMSTMLDRMS